MVQIFENKMMKKAAAAMMCAAVLASSVPLTAWAEEAGTPVPGAQGSSAETAGSIGESQQSSEGAQAGGPGVVQESEAAPQETAVPAAGAEASGSADENAQAAAAAWEAERAGLQLHQSYAGTVKPWLFYKAAYDERQQPFERGKDLWWYKKVINEKLYQPLKKAGIKLVLMVVPDKETLYGEDYLPEAMKEALRKPDRIDQFRDYMQKNFPELDIYYPEADMLAAKANGLPLYYASDSHWNFVGAGVCAEGLMRHLGAEYALSEPPEISYRLTGETARGDLQEFEGLDESWNRVEYEAQGMWTAEKVYSANDPETGEEIYAQYRAQDERALPKTLYFCGDSYRWYIQYLLNGQFRDSYFVQRYQFSAADAIAHGADVFVYELPERFLPQLGSLIS